jgi:hypothetical protein
MRLEPLYRLRFTYPESWAVGLDGGWQQLFLSPRGAARDRSPVASAERTSPGRKARKAASGLTSAPSSRPTTGT